MKTLVILATLLVWVIAAPAQDYGKDRTMQDEEVMGRAMEGLNPNERSTAREAMRSMFGSERELLLTNLRRAIQLGKDRRVLSVEQVNERVMDAMNDDQKSAWGSMTNRMTSIQRDVIRKMIFNSYQNANAPMMLEGKLMGGHMKLDEPALRETLMAGMNNYDRRQANALIDGMTDGEKMLLMRMFENYARSHGSESSTNRSVIEREFAFLSKLRI